MWSVLAWLDRNLEKTIIIAAYSTCAGIIAVEVFRRYVLSEQAPWSTTVPAYMFLWLTWIGAAHGAKIRAHLSFGEVRDRLPRNVQFVLMQIFYGVGLLHLQFDNQSVVPGTDTIPQWWFYSATPVGWLLLVFRVLQNVVKDCISMRTGAPLLVGSGLAAD
jgi:TRAP-type C4-dicarboxylate transport system permease small subunit